jgi:hypothetical protein
MSDVQGLKGRNGGHGDPHFQLKKWVANRENGWRNIFFPNIHRRNLPQQICVPRQSVP